MCNHNSAYKPWTASALCEIDAGRKVVFVTRSGFTFDQDRAAKALCEAVLALSSLHRIKPDLVATSLFSIIARGYEHEIAIQTADVTRAVEATERAGLRLLWCLNEELLVVRCEPA